MRAFFGVEAPEFVRTRVTRLIDSIRADHPVKWVGFENLHITLKFLGEVAEPDLAAVIAGAEKISDQFRSFQMSLEGVGCFPDRRNPRVVWVGVKEGAATMVELQKGLDRDLANLGFEVDERYHPHLTIGRVKRRCDLAAALEQKFATAVFPIAGFVLFKSTLTPAGPIYEVFKNFPFPTA